MGPGGPWRALAYRLPCASLNLLENTTMPRTKLNEASIGRATARCGGNARIGLTDMDQKGLMLRITPNEITGCCCAATTIRGIGCSVWVAIRPLA